MALSGLQKRRIVIGAVAAVFILIILGIVLAIVFRSDTASSTPLSTPGRPPTDANSSPGSSTGAADSSDDIQYVTRAGDTIDKIANYYYGDPKRVRDIADPNNLFPPYPVPPGTVLRIINPTRRRLTYTVLSWDTIMDLSILFYDRPDLTSLIEYSNNLIQPYTLEPGQVLQYFVE